MFKAATTTVLLSAGLLCSVAPARAGGIAESIQPQPDAPVQISGCTAGIQFVSNGWGTSFSRLNTGVDFKNTSAKVSVAVLFRLQLSNAFGDVLGNIFGQATGQFATGAVISGNRWSNTDTWPGLAVVQCSVSRVLFFDGSVWPEPQGQASPTPSPSP